MAEYINWLKNKAEDSDWVKVKLENGLYKDQLQDLQIDTATSFIASTIQLLETKKMSKVYGELWPDLVLSLQILLNDYYKTKLELKTDALYGWVNSNLSKVVKKFQKEKSLAVDGRAGAETLQALIDVYKPWNNTPEVDLSSPFSKIIAIKGVRFKVKIYNTGSVSVRRLNAANKPINPMYKMIFKKFAKAPGIGANATVKADWEVSPSDLYTQTFYNQQTGKIVPYIYEWNKLKSNKLWLTKLIK